MSALQATQITETFQETAQIAKSMESYAILLRRELHKIPELSWHETKTMAFIQKELKAIIKQSKLPFTVKELKGGLAVDLDLCPGDPKILFRADIDGLPIKEETSLSFSSKHPGLMHACGHDWHAAMLIAAFRCIALCEIETMVNIRFVWQRAEEYTKGESGGESMVKEGVCDGIDFVYGLHVSSVQESGTFLSRPGVMMSNASHLNFEIDCSGGHVMHPEIGSNAIHILSDIHNALRGIEGLYFKAEEPIAFVPSIFRCGNAHNIRPNHGQMGYSLRSFLKVSERDAFVKVVQRKIKSIVATYPTARLSSYEFFPGFPSLINNVQSYHFVKEVLLTANFTVDDVSLMFSGEDFSYFLGERPGSYWLLGAKQKGSSDHHSPTFNPDESVLWQGVLFWLKLAEKKHTFN